jgi:hypothetical protein
MTNNQHKPQEKHNMFKTANQEELQVRIETAQALYRDRKAGIDMAAASIEETGRTIARHVDGGVETFLCPSAYEIIPTLMAQLELGYKLHPANVVVCGIDQYGENAFDLYLYKPDHVIAEALEQIAKDETLRYEAEVAEANEQFIQQQVDAQIRVDLAREERERAVAEAERRAQVEKDIRATFQPAEAAPVSTKGRK